MSEIVANARRMVDSANVPIIADSDTGYGKELNAIRTVRQYESAEDAIRRLNAALDASADVAFVEATSTMEQLTRHTPHRRLGVQSAIVPGMLVMAATQVFEEKLLELKDSRRHPPIERSPSVQHFFERWGAKE